MTKKPIVNEAQPQEPLRVKSPDEFTSLTLAARVDALMENRRAVFMHNLKVLRERNNISSERKMCEEVFEGMISPPQLTTYKRPGQYIPLKVMAVAAAAFNTSIEKLCGEILSGEDHVSSSIESVSGRPIGEYQKYLGTFSLAYYDTGKPLGANSGHTTKALKYAVMTIFSEINAVGDASFRVTGLFNCSKTDFAEITALLSHYDLAKSSPQVRRHYEDLAKRPQEADSVKSRMKCLYDGSLRLTDNMAEIDFRQVYGKDEVHILMHNRAAGSSEGKSYRGGLATMMSVSRGAEHMPCIQALLINRGTFDRWAKEELANLLYLQPPEVQLNAEVKNVIDYMRWLYGQGEVQDAPPMSNEDREYCLSSYVEKKLSDVLKRNFLSFYKVSLEMDSDVYKLLGRGEQ